MEVIRFQCPACLTSLTVPPEAAGFQGPCPKCSVEIIGPNPALGLVARLPVIDPPTELIPPSEPFAGGHESPEDPILSWPDPLAASSDETGDGHEEVAAMHAESTAEELDDASREFVPPYLASRTDEAPSPPPARKSSGFSGMVLTLSCIFCSIIAFVAGSSSARRAPEEKAPINSSNQTEQPTTPPEAVHVPTPPSSPEASPPKVEEKKSIGPEATLKAFLDAEGWLARSSYVMFPESVRPRMEAHAETSSDGPIKAIDLSLFEVTKQAHIFKIATPGIPDGFPVAVARNNNIWQVDWEAFIDFHDDRFMSFANGKAGDHGNFHLFVKPVEPDGSASFFERVLLNPPMPGREQSAYVKRGSVTLARIKGIFDQRAGLSEEVFNKLIEGQGPPMVLALSYKVNSEGKSYLLIEDVVAVGWGPGEP